MSRPEFELGWLGDGSRNLYREALSDDGVSSLLSELKETDRETHEHCLRVAGMVAVFAVSGAVEFNKEWTTNLVRSAALHDMGKIDLSRSILHKKGPLSADEWSNVKKHPENGYFRVTNKLDSYSSIPILLHHTLQTVVYPPVEMQAGLLRSVELPASALVSEDTTIATTLIAVADNLDSRYPASDEGIRSYADGQREYGLDELPALVKASFDEARTIHLLGQDRLLNVLLTVSQDTFLKQQS
jgi:hypothetical protein